MERRATPTETGLSVGFIGQFPEKGGCCSESRIGAAPSNRIFSPNSVVVDMSFALYKRLLPPTAVDHAVTASVTSPKALELVVARGCVLSLYAVRTSLHVRVQHIILF
jgi:hypothetical protein